MRISKYEIVKKKNAYQTYFRDRVGVAAGGRSRELVYKFDYLYQNIMILTSSVQSFPLIFLVYIYIPQVCTFIYLNCLSISKP